MLFFFLASAVFGSSNGNLYECDQTEQTIDGVDYTFCVFNAKTGDCGDLACLPSVAGNTYVSIQDYPQGDLMVADASGAQLSVSPKPWTDGDQLIVSSTTVSDEDWAYSLSFSLIAPLRNAMMMTPWEILPEAEWTRYTRALTDCRIKTEDEMGDHGTAYSTDNVYNLLGHSTGSHHAYLQYLEESAIDLVCLMTDLSMSRCDTIRETWEIEEGTHCDCWTQAYIGLWGTDPEVEDGYFSSCGSTTTSTADPDDADGMPDVSCYREWWESSSCEGGESFTSTYDFTSRDCITFSEIYNNNDPRSSTRQGQCTDDQCQECQDYPDSNGDDSGFWNPYTCHECSFTENCSFVKIDCEDLVTCANVACDECPPNWTSEWEDGECCPSCIDNAAGSLVTMVAFVTALIFSF